MASTNEQLIGAARSNNEELATSLLEGKSPTVISATINTIRDPVGNTLLHIAASSGALDVLYFLLDQEGVEIDPINRLQGDTPLHCAVRYGSTDKEAAQAVIELLIECGADPLIRNNDKKLAIDYTEDPDLVQVLRGAQYAAEMAHEKPMASQMADMGVEEEEPDEGESDNEIE